MYDVIVVGSALAGSTAACLLAEGGYRVLLLEKDTFPRHKLCGEFVSPEAQATFRRLGVLADVRRAGAVPIEATRLTTAGGAAFAADLPAAGLGISRYRLDALLFDRADAFGVERRDDTKVRAVSGNLADGFTVETRAAAFEGRIVIGAYGRHGVLDRTLDRASAGTRSSQVAFKAHYAGIDGSDRVEVHAFPGGYCGLSPVEGDRVNVCWIGRTDVLKAADGEPEAMIERACAQNGALAERLSSGTRISDSFLAVSQVHLTRKSTFDGGVCMIGDAAGMIAPLCGDGMAMALRSAELAVGPAMDFLADRISARAFRRRYTAAWREAFSTRMRLGRWIHRSALHPTCASAVVHACRLVPGLGRWLMRRTRG